MTDIISSTANPIVKSFKRLHRARGRSEERSSLIEGPTVFAEALASGVAVKSTLIEKGDDVASELCDRFEVPATVVTAEVLAAASDTVHPKSPVAMIAIPQPDRMHYRDTLVLRHVSDPGNVGTMIRSAGAFGWDVCVTGDSAHPWNPKVIRAGMGAHFYVHLSFSTDPIADAKELGLDVVASVVSGGETPERGEHPIALLIGSEAHGLPVGDITEADRQMTLPTDIATESLNAAVAASILMYTLK